MGFREYDAEVIEQEVLARELEMTRYLFIIRARGSHRLVTRVAPRGETVKRRDNVVVVRYSSDGMLLREMGLGVTVDW